MKTVIASFLLFLSSLAFAEPLTLVTMTGVGSLSDTALRQASPAIERHTGRKVVIINAPGADGLIAVNHLMSQPASTHTLLVGNSSLGYLRATKGLTVPVVPVAGLTQSVMAVFVPASSSAQTVADLKGRRLLAAVTSPMVKVSVQLFSDDNGLSSDPVGYSQFGQAVVDLAAGRLDYMLAPAGVSSLEGMLAAGKVRQIADLGPMFTWSAFYARDGSLNPALSAQLVAAVREAPFFKVAAFPALPAAVIAMERGEAKLMRRAIDTAR